MVPVSSFEINDVIRTSLLLLKILGKVGRVGGLATSSLGLFPLKNGWGVSPRTP